MEIGNNVFGVMALDILQHNVPQEAYLVYLLRKNSPLSKRKLKGQLKFMRLLTIRKMRMMITTMSGVKTTL